MSLPKKERKTDEPITKLCKTFYGITNESNFSAKGNITVCHYFLLHYFLFLYNKIKYLNKKDFMCLIIIYLNRVQVIMMKC